MDRDLLRYIKDTLLESATFGLEAIKDAIDLIQVDTTAIEGKVDTVDTVVDALTVQQNSLADRILTARQQCLPAAGNPIQCTDEGAAGAWNNGTWVEISANIGGADIVPLGVFVANVSAADDFELDIGVGAAAAEVVVGTLPFGDDENFIPFASFAKVDANSRVAGRIRSKASNGKTADLKLAYIEV